MPRAALPQELFEERRAVLEVLPTALRALVHVKTFHSTHSLILQR